MNRIVFVLVGALMLTACGDTGRGEKVGQIIKLNKQGLFCQTWEAELIRGGLNNGSGASSTVFDFTIEDPDLVPAVQAALDGQYEVKIHYNMEWSKACRSDSGDHFLNRVERLQGQGTPHGGGRAESEGRKTPEAHEGIEGIGSVGTHCGHLQRLRIGP